ncbi:MULTISPECIES: adenylate/guanylate cyclase domain-containing protein [Gordonia]|uniref:adenylate/guanylate cyclase domain-containing protein n=1 Tax=Gordonia TaxID=2053 RepID=UPI0007EA1887|nr:MULTISPECIES: adenylate/guanylate cyclase domain-containing protein [Gordonia]MCM3896393.1 adenylate/guanylate cyclase domain-containing protein [Gordonia sputi]OBA33251.1 guanylyl cyclase [Gordonia sp. 852002-51296_SCH5728562-b]
MTSDDDTTPGSTPPDDKPVPSGPARVGEFLTRADRTPSLIRAAQLPRKLTPETVPELDLSRPTRLSDRMEKLLTGSDRSPSASRELALSVVKVWQALVDRRSATATASGDVTVLFTDLVGFSSWALRAGDDRVLSLIGEVNRVSSDIVGAHRGRIVKSLGDGVMAVFPDAADAILAAFELCGAVSAITHDDYRAQLRAGVHTGTPRQVGGDYLGVDVNIAARVADAAGTGEVLATSDALQSAEGLQLLSRKRRFKAKGTPRDLEVFAVVPLLDE